MLNKIGKIAGLVAFWLSVIIAILFFIKDSPALEAAITKIGDLPTDMKIAEIDNLATNWNGLFLNYALILLIISSISVILFAIINLVSNFLDKPKSAIKPLISVLIIVVLCVLSYAVADGTMPNFLGAQNMSFPESTIRMVDASLYGMYIVMGSTIIALIYGEVAKLLR